MATEFRRYGSGGTKNLIIDVGDEGGGDEMFGVQLISYLVDNSFTPYRRIEFKTKKFKSRKYSTTSWFEYVIIKTFYLRFRKEGDTYSLTNARQTKTQNPSPIHFNGKGLRDHQRSDGVCHL